MPNLTCICCGSDNLKADYPEAAYQGIVAELDGGEVVMEYDGGYGTYDGSGENETYRCGECYAEARSLEALVGEDPDGAHERLSIIRLINAKLSEAAALADELVRTKHGEPPLPPKGMVA